MRDTSDDDTVRNEAANLLRRSDYNRLVNELLDVLDNPKEGARFRSFAVQHLWQNATDAGEEGKSRIMTRLREERGLSRAELGRRSGMSDMEVGFIETGSKPIRCENLVCLAVGLDVSPVASFEGW